MFLDGALKCEKFPMCTYVRETIEGWPLSGKAPICNALLDFVVVATNLSLTKDHLKLFLF